MSSSGLQPSCRRCQCDRVKQNGRLHASRCSCYQACRSLVWALCIPCVLPLEVLLSSYVTHALSSCAPLAMEIADLPSMDLLSIQVSRVPVRP